MAGTSIREVVSVDYMVRSREDGLAVDISDPGTRRAALIDALEESRGGTCDCPTDEVRKVAQVLVDGEDHEELHLTLVPHRGERLDIVEVDRAVRWTIIRSGGALPYS